MGVRKKLMLETGGSDKSMPQIIAVSKPEPKKERNLVNRLFSNRFFGLKKEAPQPGKAIENMAKVFDKKMTKTTPEAPLKWDSSEKLTLGQTIMRLKQIKAAKEKKELEEQAQAAEREIQEQKKLMDSGKLSLGQTLALLKKMKAKQELEAKLNPEQAKPDPAPKPAPTNSLAAKIIKMRLEKAETEVKMQKSKS